MLRHIFQADISYPVSKIGTAYYKYRPIDYNKCRHECASNITVSVALLLSFSAYIEPRCAVTFVDSRRKYLSTVNEQ